MTRTGLKEADAERNAIAWELYLTFFSHCDQTGCGNIAENTDIKHLYGAFERIYDPLGNVSFATWSNCSNYDSTDSPSTSAVPNGNSGYIRESMVVDPNNPLIFSYEYIAVNCQFLDDPVNPALKSKINGRIQYSTTNDVLIGSDTFMLDYSYIQSGLETDPPGTPYLKESWSSNPDSLVSSDTADLTLSGTYSGKTTNLTMIEFGSGTIAYNLTLNGFSNSGALSRTYENLNDTGAYTWYENTAETLEDTLNGRYIEDDSVQRSDMTFTALRYIDKIYSEEDPRSASERWYFSYSLDGQIEFTAVADNLCPEVNGTFAFSTTTPVKWDLQTTNSDPIEGQEVINGNVTLIYNPNGTVTADVNGQMKTYATKEDLYMVCP